MSWFSDLFSPKKQTTQLEEMLTDEQKQAMSTLSNYTNTGKVGDYQAGEKYAGALGEYNMTDLEKEGQNQLYQLIKGGMPEMYQLGANEIKSVLSTDKYDPYAKGGVYEGYKKNVLQEGKEASDVMKRNMAVTGDLYSTENARQHEKLAETQTDQLNNKLAELFDVFAQRKLGAATTAANMGITEENINQQRIGLSQTVGALERMLKDQEAKDKFNEWNRSRSEWLNTLQTANSLMNKNVDYGQKSISTTSPSTLMSMLGEISPLVGSYNQAEYGYNTNQSSIGGMLSGITGKNTEQAKSATTAPVAGLNTGVSPDDLSKLIFSFL